MKRPDYTIRRAAERDAAALLDIYAPYIRDTVITFEYDVPTAEEFAARIGETAALHPYLVCERDGRPVGYAYAHRIRERAAYDWAAELSIYLAPAAQGQGVGTALMERAKRWARERGLGGLALETQDTNLIACRFYQKCGLEIGAVNTMLYKNMPAPACEDIAIFWYLKFPETEGKA